MQNPSDEKKFLGLVYITSMNRPDAALALAELYGFEGKRESRIGSICVVGAGLDTAIFCDIVGQVYMPGAPRNSNSVLPVGLAAAEPQPPDSAMVRPALERRNENHEPLYARSIRRLSDTSAAEAVIRNGVTFTAEGAMILSAPATSLAASLALPGVMETYKDRIRLLLIVDSGTPQQDVPALRRILSEWPTPIVFCGREVGEALLFPASHIESDFSWAPSNPVVDAYRAFRPMPYDAPSYDVAAAFYAVRPDSGFFRLSETGSVSVSDDGRMQFAANSAGSVRKLIVDPMLKDKAIQAFVEIACAKPVPPPARIRRRPDAGAAQQAPPPDQKIAPKAPDNKQE